MSKRYFTGKPCPAGHIAERYISNGCCVICSAEKKKAWHKANIAHVLKKNQEWREANPEKYQLSRKAVTKRYTAANKEKVRAAKDSWKRKNPGYHSAASARWREENPEKALAIVHRRRAAKLQSGGSYSAQDVHLLDAAQNHRCYWCCRRVFSLTIEHVIPLSRGGSNGVDNIRLACLRCNQQKNNQMPLDFACRLLGGK